MGVIALCAFLLIAFALLAKYTSFVFWFCISVVWLLFMLTKAFKDHLDEKDS